jgi:hypothetical protein
VPVNQIFRLGSFAVPSIIETLRGG